MHSDREALYVFQLQFSDNENRLPNMVENGEVGLHIQLYWLLWQRVVFTWAMLHAALRE